MINQSIIRGKPFCYTHAFQALTASGGAASPVIITNSNCDFEIFEIRGVVYKAAAFTGSLLLTLSLSNGELFQNVAFDVLSFAASQQNSFSGYAIQLHSGIVIPAKSEITCNYVNNNGEAIIGVQVQLWGRNTVS